MSRWWPRVAHWLFGRHAFAPCVLTDLFGNRYDGRICTICNVFDEDAWQLVAPRTSNSSSLAGGL